jgi:NhaP-type Na+/H+ or K+/H+ antiporter
VCAALLQVGADEKLSSVIDGESLVNDGSALVIFLVLQQIVQGASLTAAQVGASYSHHSCRCTALTGGLLGMWRHAWCSTLCHTDSVSTGYSNTSGMQRLCY